MIRHEHIEKIKLFGRMLGPMSNGIPLVTVNAGLEYAQRLTTDAALQAEVKTTYSPSLAERDFKRAAQVVEKYALKTEPLKTVTPTPVVTEYKPKELEAFDILAPNTSGGYYWTVKGDAWKQAGRPNPYTWQYTSLNRKPSTPPEKKPEIPVPSYPHQYSSKFAELSLADRLRAHAEWAHYEKEVLN